MIEQVREVVGHGTPHHQPEQHSMSRLSFRDNNLGKASETLDEKARHEMPSYPIRQPSASRLFDCFVTSGLASQDTDQLVCWLIQSQWRPSQLRRLRYTSA